MGVEIVIRDVLVIQFRYHNFQRMLVHGVEGVGMLILRGVMPLMEGVVQRRCGCRVGDESVKQGVWTCRHGF